MTWLAQAGAPDPGLNPLYEFGALGIFAVLLAAAVRVLFTRVVASLQASLDAERARADRLEAELRSMNADVREKVIPALVESTASTRRLLDVIQKGER